MPTTLYYLISLLRLWKSNPDYICAEIESTVRKLSGNENLYCTYTFATEGWTWLSLTHREGETIKRRIDINFPLNIAPDMDLTKKHDAFNLEFYFGEEEAKEAARFEIKSDFTLKAILSEKMLSQLINFLQNKNMDMEVIEIMMKAKLDENLKFADL